MFFFLYSPTIKCLQRFLQCVQSQHCPAPSSCVNSLICPSAPRDHGWAAVVAELSASPGVSAVAAQPFSAAAAVRHQEEAAAGGDVPAQLRGEEADQSCRLGETRPAAASAQRRASHLTALFFLTALLFFYTMMKDTDETLATTAMHFYVKL